MNQLEREFYLEVRDAIKNFSKHAVNEINSTEDIEHSQIRKEIEEFRKLALSEKDIRNLQKIIEEAVSGAVHSIFVSIDGGTALSSKGKALALVNRETGVPITQGALHENFMDVFDD